MLKKIGIIGIVICFCFSLVNVSNRIYAQDSMEEVIISNLDELVELRDKVNKGETYQGKKVSLSSDIDLSSLDEWVPIGNGKRFSSIAMGKKFMGIFDGQNHSIIGMKINVSGSEDEAKGFFGIIDKAIVKNLHFKSANVNVPTNKLGAIAVGMMVNGSTVDNITIDQASHISVYEGAGVVGRMIKSGVIQNCVNYSNIDAVYTGAGIVNKAYYTAEGSNMVISQCKNYGNVQGVTYSSGGIVSLSASDVLNCYNEGKISAKTEAGGIVGEQTNFGTIQDCENKGSVQGGISGGIIGWIRYQNKLSNYARTSSISVLNNKNSATIEVDSQGALFSNGGIVGLIYNQANVKNNINTAPQIVGSLFASGIAGAYQKSTENWLEENPTVNVVSNFSSTPIENISGSCKALYIYDNKGVTLNLIDNIADQVVKIGDKIYDSLPVAIGNSKENDTLVLLKDITLKSGKDGDFRNGLAATFDLNGKTITGDNENATLRVVENEKVRIINGKLTAINGTFCTIIASDGDVELENVELENSTPGGNSLKCFENATISMKNVTSHSKMGGGIEATGGIVNIRDSSFVQEGYYDYNSQIMAASNGGVVNVYGGTFMAKSENYGAYIFNSGGTIHIYDGEWSAGKAVLKADNSTTSHPSVINVYGGTFDGKIDIGDQSTLLISQGTFKNTGLSKEKMMSYISPTSSLVEKDGSFVVYPQATSIRLSETSLVMNMNETKQLSAIIEPTDTLDQVVWSSSQPDVVSVDSTGKLKALKAGQAIIRATVRGIIAECNVKVIKEELVIPTLPTKPVEKPTVGITEEKSKEIINETTSQLIESIINSDKVDEKVISKEVQEKVFIAIQSGQSITTAVESKAVDVSEVDKKVVNDIENKVKTLMTGENTRAVVAQYLDLSVLLKTSEGVLGAVNKLNEPVTFTIAIPEDLKESGRKYYVMRSHDGVITMLETKQNEDGTLMFETDCFSTYALVYVDEISSPLQPEIPETTLPSVKPEVPGNQVVETSDKTQILTLVNLLALALFVGVKSFVSRKEYE